MRIKSLCLVLILISLDCLSQVNDNNPSGNRKNKSNSTYFSEIVVGMAVPLGDFAGTDIENSQSGFAGPGGFLFAGYGKLYNKRIGFEVALGVSLFSLDEEIDQLKEIDNSQEYQRGFGWWTISGLIGPYFSLPIKKFSVDFRVLAGVMDIIRPYFRNLYNNGTGKFEESVGNGYAFTWQIGAGLEYLLSDKVGVKLSLEYLNAAPDIRYQKTIAIYHVYYSKDDIKYRQPISSFNAGFGIVLHLDK